MLYLLSGLLKPAEEERGLLHARAAFVAVAPEVGRADKEECVSAQAHIDLPRERVGVLLSCRTRTSSRFRRAGTRAAALAALAVVALGASAFAPAASKASATTPVARQAWLGRDLISSASWEHLAPGWTLRVTPTRWARAHAGRYEVGVAGWNELYSKYRNRGLNQNLDGMRDQWICHQQFVAVREPRRATWNLDEWRPNVSYAETVRARCNPGGGGD